MRPFRPWLLLFLCFVCSASLSAQSTSSSAPAATSDPQAVALLQSALSALTGTASVSDVTLTGTAQRIVGSDDETGTASLEATSVGDSLMNLSFPSGNRSEIRNHAGLPLPGSLPLGIPAAATQAVQPIGAWSGPDGVLHGMANHNAMTDAAWFFPAATLTRILSSQSYVFSYVGPETLNGRSVTHVQVSQPLPASAKAPQRTATLMQHLSQMDLYLDPATLLPVGLAFNVHPDNNALIDIPIEILFSGYQTVNGVQVPFQVQRYLNSGLVLDLQFSSASLNSGLAAANFQIQ